MGYDVAVGLLVELREVIGNAEFGWRIADLRAERRREPAFLERLATAGL